MISADAYFRKGYSHLVCEDYAVASTLGTVPYAIVSDGCSSSPRTDVGARLLASAAAASLKTGNGFEPYAVIQKASDAARILELHPDSLDATLSVAYYYNQKFHISLTGDGVIVLRRRSGEILTAVYSFSPEMPPYLNYIMDVSRKESYMNVQPDMSVHVEPCNEEFQQIFWRSTERGYKGQGFDPLVASFEVPAAEYDLVVLLSDGIETFRKLEPSMSIHFSEIIDEILAFKSYAGEFITRRCNKFFKSLKTRFDGMNVDHSDDFSIASLYISEDEINK